ncbi:MAG: phospho-N-acetylmuramoyl-pentapeptide-transferase [Clostridia bacterium]|nr:phospho-N-acetylmuramoyl-pentapeptide-transferase [Clostridia bacterium]
MFESPLIYILIFIFTFTVSAFTVSKLIPLFAKGATQPIYEEGPSWHIKKAGTPTMGGLGFIIPFTAATLILCLPLHKFVGEKEAISLFITVIFVLLNAVIGIIDDATKLSHKENKGLKAGEKFFLQLTAVIIFLAARALLLDQKTSVSFSFGTVDLGIFYYFITAFILLGIINSANLTDGIDGLASVVAFAAAVSLFYVSYKTSAECSVISASLIGVSVGFMIFNVHPAKIFMGDTGSLFLGAAVASSALSLNNPFILLGVGGVYVLEGTSVVIQVLVYKLTGKRVFKMAPVHHHLEKSGWSENKICITAILLTFLLSLLVFAVCPV